MYIRTHKNTDKRARVTRLQQLTLYQQQWLASGKTDGRAACLQYGQPVAAPSIGDDRRRERLDFSGTEIVTEISKQLMSNGPHKLCSLIHLLAWGECMCVTVN